MAIFLKCLLDKGVITQEQYDELMALIPTIAAGGEVGLLSLIAALGIINNSQLNSTPSMDIIGFQEMTIDAVTAGQLNIPTGATAALITAYHDDAIFRLDGIPVAPDVGHFFPQDTTINVNELTGFQAIAANTSVKLFITYYK